MIGLALDIIRQELNNYLVLKLDQAPDTNVITLFNVSQLGSEGGSGNNNDASANAFFTLVNIEEDRISKSPENFIRNTNGTLTYKNPKIFLNLYLLFSINNTSEYKTALGQLSFIIQFFQYKNVFTPLTTPALPAGVDELIFDLYTISFQDLNNLWGILGSKYLPSIMYKMRLIAISEEFELGGAGLIQKIAVNSKSLQQ